MTDFGGIEWSGEGFNQRALYRIVCTSPDWCSHVHAGQIWTGMTLPSEEFERDLATEVLALEGCTVDLRVYRMRPDAAPFPEGCASALGLLLDRAYVCDCPLAEAVPKPDWQSGKIAGTPADYVASVTVSEEPAARVALQHAATGAAADFACNDWATARARSASYRVVVTDPRWLAHLAVGMRWVSWGSCALADEDA